MGSLSNSVNKNITQTEKNTMKNNSNIVSYNFNINGNEKNKEKKLGINDNI